MGEEVSIVQVEAAFILNFIRLVEPIAKVSEQTVICVTQLDAKAALSNLVAKKPEIASSVGVRVVSSDFTGCSVGFESEINKGTILKHTSTTSGDPILRIVSSESSCVPGANIRFFIENGKVRFGVNLEKSKKDGLTISSKLLALAEIDSCE